MHFRTSLFSSLSHCLYQKVEYKNVSPLVTHAGGYAVCSPEAQIPSDHNMGITEACPDSSSMSFSDGNDNCSSPSTQGTIRQVFNYVVNHFVVFSKILNALLPYSWCHIVICTSAAFLRTSIGPLFILYVC